MGDEYISTVIIQTGGQKSAIQCDVVELRSNYKDKVL